MKYFVCSDIHGFYEEWMKALQEKQFDIKNNDHKLIFCGDAFDRGQQAVEVFKFLKDLQQKNKLIFIRGNHEDLLFECVNELKDLDGCAHTYHYSNGTIDTILQFMQANIRDEVLEFINKNSINYFETQKYIFVHSWIPILEFCYDKNWRNASTARWNKARWCNPVEISSNKIFEPKKTIVFGHWHCSAFWHNQNSQKYDEFGKKANFEPFVTKKFISIDACTAHSNKVNVLLLED